MQTLEIKVPEGKARLIKGLLKELGVIVKVKKENNIPNSDTLAAMNELKAGNSKALTNFLKVSEPRYV